MESQDFSTDGSEAAVHGSETLLAQQEERVRKEKEALLRALEEAQQKEERIRRKRAAIRDGLVKHYEALKAAAQGAMEPASTGCISLCRHRDDISLDVEVSEVEELVDEENKGVEKAEGVEVGLVKYYEALKVATQGAMTPPAAACMSWRHHRDDISLDVEASGVPTVKSHEAPKDATRKETGEEAAMEPAAAGCISWCHHRDNVSLDVEASGVDELVDEENGVEGVEAVVGIVTLIPANKITNKMEAYLSPTKVHESGGPSVANSASLLPCDSTVSTASYTSISDSWSGDTSARFADMKDEDDGNAMDGICGVFNPFSHCHASDDDEVAAFIDPVPEGDAASYSVASTDGKSAASDDATSFTVKTEYAEDSLHVPW